MLYKIKELPLFNYTVNFTKPTQVLFDGIYLAITAYNSENAGRVLLIKISSCHADSLKFIYHLEEN